MIITQNALTWYLYMNRKIDYSEISKSLVYGINTDTACRAACDYNSGCQSYILQTDRSTTFTSCYTVVETLNVFVDKIIHRDVRDIIIGIKIPSITPLVYFHNFVPTSETDFNRSLSLASDFNFSPTKSETYLSTTYTNLLKIPSTSFKTCSSIAQSLTSELTSVSSCLNVIPKNQRLKFSINGGFCSIKLKGLIPFSCDNTFLKATSWLVTIFLFLLVCLWK